MAGADPCHPQGPGGYNYCNNGPGARLPPGCNCGWGPGVAQPSLRPVPIAPILHTTSDRPCPKNFGTWAQGPVINYFAPFDPHSGNLDFVSDARYITVAGHGAPGVGKIAPTPLPMELVDAKAVAQDIHKIRMMPGNGVKGTRIAACESAKTKDGSTTDPLAQQMTPISRSMVNR